MDMAVRDYNSRLGDPQSAKFGTFSYLPPMDAASIRKQVQYMVDQGWNCAIEHVEPANSSNNYWYMWKLPMFGETDVNIIMDELTACRNANTGNHIRVIGYDNKKQSQGQSMVIYRGDI